MRVLIPSALLSYTGNQWVQAQGETLGDVMADLDRQFPGITFRAVDEHGRLRAHMRFFYNGVALEALSAPLEGDAELFIVQALSGG